MKAYERFHREIAAIKKLDHPRIIKIFDHSDPDHDFQFYVMEYIDGARSLKKLLGTPDNPFYGDPLKSIRLFRQLSEAIGQFEQIKIVHRDLSPANILVLPNEDVKVIDFGVCYDADGEVITLVDEGVGARNYTAPECEAGGGGPVTTAADLYSAGKILWAAVTNMQAFAREQFAFTSHTMLKLFSDPRLYHLHHIFATTIRHDLDKRFGNAEIAIVYANRVETLISNGYPPFESFADLRTCPRCGWGELKELTVMNRTTEGRVMHGFRCNFCGICFSIDTTTIREIFQRRQQYR